MAAPVDTSIPCGDLPNSAPNCGWFTGKPFRKDTRGSGWECVPVQPTSEFLLTQNLASAKPPPIASLQYHENVRPGNHCQGMPSQKRLHAPYGSIGCIDSPLSRVAPNFKFSLFASPV